MSKTTVVLVVDDDEDDFFFTQRVLRRHTQAEIVRVDSGRAALDYLSGRGVYADRTAYPLPGLIFLDLKMTHGTGHEVLAAIRAQPPQPLPRIFVLTGSNETRDHELVKGSGVAEGYIVKPLRHEHLDPIFTRPEDAR